MKIENLIALRYFRSKKRNGVLSFLSITSIIGIVLGTAALILVVSVMSGFSDNLKEKMMGANSEIIITDFSGVPIRSYKETLEKVKGVEGVRGASPFINSQAVVTTEKGVSGIILKGIDPILEQDVSRIKSFMLIGKVDSLINKPDEPNSIILGEDLAFSLMASVGDTITLISPNTVRGPFGINPKMRKFKVTGIFDTGVYEYNANMAYIGLEAAQEFVGYDNESITGIGVSTLKNHNSILLASKISSNIDEKLWARDWLSMNKSLFSALQLEKYAMFIVLTLIIVVASFSIVSMIAITVRDKVKDIAILRAYGASSKFIRRIFIKQGLLVGIIGTLIGDLIAFILSLLVIKFKIIKLPKDIYFMDSLPMNMDFSVYLFVTICAIAITFFASLFPSMQAAKMQPVEGLRKD